MTTVLEGRELDKSFGRTRALRGASVSLSDGEILAVNRATRYNAIRYE